MEDAMFSDSDDFERGVRISLGKLSTEKNGGFK
jgi:hypothetical protein